MKETPPSITQIEMTDSDIEAEFAKPQPKLQNPIATKIRKLCHDYREGKPLAGITEYSCGCRYESAFNAYHDRHCARCHRELWEAQPTQWEAAYNQAMRGPDLA